jgi:hypothetical protein
VESSCECGNEPSGSLENYQVVTQLVLSRVVLSSIELVSTSKPAATAFVHFPSSG